MRTIKTVSVEVQIDDHDFEELSKYQWYWDGKYAFTKVGERYITMHQLLYEVDGVDNVVDHMDRNRLNNQRNNLREATRSQNASNYVKSTTKLFRGVRFVNDKPRKNPYYADIRVDGQKTFLGAFSNPIDAAIAYNLAAAQVYGDFATLNPIPFCGVSTLARNPNKNVLNEIFS